MAPEMLTFDFPFHALAGIYQLRIIVVLEILNDLDAHQLNLVFEKLPLGCGAVTELIVISKVIFFKNSTSQNHF